MNKILIFFAISIFSLAVPALAQLSGEDTLPGDPCAAGETGYVRRNASVSQDASEITLICNGSTWVSATQGAVDWSELSGVPAGFADGTDDTGAIASQAEAEAGTNNAKRMTPLRTAQAISALGSGITALTGDVTASGSGSVAASISANAITSAKIAADTITAADIAANAVTSAELAGNAVTSAKIQDGQVTSADIANGTITGTDIASNTIPAGDTNFVGALTEGKWCTVSGGKIVCASDAPGGGGSGGLEYLGVTASLGWKVDSEAQIDAACVTAYGTGARGAYIGEILPIIGEVTLGAGRVKGRARTNFIIGQNDGFNIRLLIMDGYPYGLSSTGPADCYGNTSSGQGPQVSATSFGGLACTTNAAWHCVKGSLAAN